MSDPPTKPPTTTPYSLAQLALYALRLGTTGFGGPVALVGYMHRDLVEHRHWISEADFKEGLTLAQLMPGPLAAQLAIYLGYVHHSIPGATLVGLLFALPSFLIVVALGWAYLAYGGLPWMQAAFFGIGPCVIAIITVSAHKLTRKSIGRDRLLWATYLASAAATIITETESAFLFLGAGLLFWAVRSRKSTPPAASCFMLPLAAATPLPHAILSYVYTQIALFFTKAGAFVFGSGLAIIPFLYSGVVKEHAWLSESEFLDAVAVAMITPGPVVITVGFIGYLVTGRGADPLSGLLGATVASLATFLPCYLFTILPAPYFKKHGKRPGLIAFIEGVTAAAIGAIAGACVVLGRRTLLTPSLGQTLPKLALFLLTLAVLLRFKKLQEPIVILAGALAGFLIFPFISH